MMPPSNWVERLFSELHLGLVPYWQAVESRGAMLMAGVLVLAALSWWTSRVAEKSSLATS